MSSIRLRQIVLAGITVLLVEGCERSQNTNQPPLAEARRGFTTTLIRQQTIGEPVAAPPSALFRSVTYQSPIGNLAAYVSPSPKDGRKHPAIIWIVGGFDNSIGDFAWQPAPPENDQSASAFRLAGIVMMYPSLRGGNKNPGFLEGFYGEVDDVLGAAEFLARQDYVNPDRIYLGGHSTGGTLALLVAECTNRFRAVFAFGPVGDIRGYGQENLPFNISDRHEGDLRSPKKWLQSIQTRTFVFEGARRDSNIRELHSMSRASKNAQIHFHPVKGADHFSILAPVSRLIAAKILSDDSAAPNIAFASKELSEAAAK